MQFEDLIQQVISGAYTKKQLMQLIEYASNKMNSKMEFTNNITEQNYTNDELIELIKCAGSKLKLQTISNYAKEHNLTYNGVKKCRKIVTLFDVKFVVGVE